MVPFLDPETFSESRPHTGRIERQPQLSATGGTGGGGRCGGGSVAGTGGRGGGSVGGTGARAVRRRLGLLRTSQGRHLDLRPPRR